MAMGSYYFLFVLVSKPTCHLIVYLKVGGAKLPCLVDVDIVGNCTSLGALAKSLRISCLVTLGTHLYFEEYVSPVTC